MARASSCGSSPYRAESGRRTYACRNTKVTRCSPGGRTRSCPAGQRDAGVVIANSSYKDIAIVRAGNGYQPDLHAFAISPRGTALFTVYDAIRCNLSAYGGPANGAVADTLFQEIDLRTGLVRFEWHALDHVPVTNSYMPIGGGGTPLSPWDWFHINAVSEHGPNLLVDSRNTWAAYEVQASGGQVAWRLGGKQSSFAMGPGAAPAYQHDVREEPDGTISFFDNGGTPKVHSQSRVIVLSLNRQKMTANARLELHPHTAALGAEPRRFSTAGRRQLVRRLGPGTVFLGIRPRRQIAVRRPSPGALPVLYGAQVPLDGRPNAAAAARRARRLSRRRRRLRQLERSHGRDAMGSIGRDQSSRALAIGGRSAQWLRDGDRKPERPALSRGAGARGSGSGAGHLGHRQSLSSFRQAGTEFRGSMPALSRSDLAEKVGNLSLRTDAWSGMIERCPRTKPSPNRDPRLPGGPEPRRHRPARGVRRGADADRSHRSSRSWL